MPISEESTPQPGMTQLSINIPLPEGSGLFVNVYIQSDGTATEATMDETITSLVDHLQEWPGRHPDANVTGQKYAVELYPVLPANPIPPPPPPEEPGEAVPAVPE